ncbi:MAG: hypothetical protein MUF61_00280 [archaeon]|jgi:hypothetical protein|nr:hypothetical protein [archaeon]
MAKKAKKPKPYSFRIVRGYNVSIRQTSFFYPSNGTHEELDTFMQTVWPAFQNLAPFITKGNIPSFLEKILNSEVCDRMKAHGRTRLTKISLRDFCQTLSEDMAFYVKSIGVEKAEDPIYEFKEGHLEGYLARAKSSLVGYSPDGRMYTSQAEEEAEITKEQPIK